MSRQFRRYLALMLTGLMLLSTGSTAYAEDGNAAVAASSGGEMIAAEAPQVDAPAEPVQEIVVPAQEQPPVEIPQENIEPVQPAEEPVQEVVPEIPEAQETPDTEEMYFVDETEPLPEDAGQAENPETDITETGAEGTDAVQGSEEPQACYGGAEKRRPGRPSGEALRTRRQDGCGSCGRATEKEKDNKEYS